MTKKGLEFVQDAVRYDFFDIMLNCEYLTPDELADLMETIESE